MGEEWGFVGTMVVLALLCLLILRLMRMGERQQEPFGRIYCYCVAAILLFHVLVNVGMTIGLMPVMGIPLPLVSYGGSSLMAFTILLFIAVRLDASTRQYSLITFTHMIRYNPRGLSPNEVAESRRQHGDNVITPPKDDSVWKLLADKFRDPIIRILLLAAVLCRWPWFCDGEFHRVHWYYLCDYFSHLCRLFLRVGCHAAFQAAQSGE